MKIQKITSPGGIKAWLVEEYSVPLISMKFAFEGGSSQDETGREGTGYLMSGLLDEGAGDISAADFQAKLDEMAIKMSFDANLENFTGSFKTLIDNQGEAFRLLKLAITQPRFDPDAIERIRKQILTSLKMEMKDPDAMASRAWFKQVFDTHPFARSRKGTIESLGAITADDLKAYHKKNMTKDNFFVTVVGAIDAETLGKKLDEVFGDLPVRGELREVSAFTIPDQERKIIIEHDVPQSVVQFGMRGILREDPDFIPAYILNYILGGGGFSSRLMEEVREKRGLAYSVHSYLYPMKKTAMFMGGVATKNEAVEKSIAVIRAEFEKMAKQGPTQKELDDAITYLTGSYALRFDSSGKIANQLLWVQMEEHLDSDYFEKRNDLIKKVTLEDLKRVSKRLFDSGKLIITIVGKPVSSAVSPPKESVKADDKS